VQEQGTRKKGLKFADPSTSFQVAITAGCQQRLHDIECQNDDTCLTAQKVGREIRLFDN
jgi:hypothetical protein